MLHFQSHLLLHFLWCPPIMQWLQSAFTLLPVTSQSPASSPGQPTPQHQPCQPASNKVHGTVWMSNALVQDFIETLGERPNKRVRKIIRRVQRQQARAARAQKSANERYQQEHQERMRQGRERLQQKITTSLRTCEREALTLQQRIRQLEEVLGDRAPPVTHFVTHSTTPLVTPPGAPAPARKVSSHFEKTSQYETNAWAAPASICRGTHPGVVPLAGMHTSECCQNVPACLTHV
jgi:hypothetical protein